MATINEFIREIDEGTVSDAKRRELLVAATGVIGGAGLLVEDADGPSAVAGIQAGDVLLAINGTPARSVEQVRDVVARADKSVALLIQRGGDKIFVPVRIG